MDTFIKEFSKENIVLGAATISPSGCKNIPIKYKKKDSKVNFSFQTPRMLSFGINSWQDSNNKPVYTISMSFLDMETNPKLLEFYKFCSSMDEWALEVLNKNAWDWLNRKNIDTEELKNIYIPLVKKSLDTSKPDHIKFKIKAKDSGFQTKFFDNEKNVISGSDIKHIFNIGSHVRSIIQCTGFWTMDGKLGLSWKILQMLVEPRITKPIQYESDDE